LTPTRRVSTIGRWWPALVWTGLIFTASSIPGSKLDDVGFDFPDKLVHGIEYAILGFLVFSAVRSEGSSGAARAFVVALSWAWLTGIADENYQRLIPLRDPSLADWWADVVGAVVGAAIAWRIGFRGPWARRRER
jgi:VanZ family protein